MTALEKLFVTLIVVIYSITFIFFLAGTDSDKNAEKKYQKYVGTVKYLESYYSGTRNRVQEIARDGWIDNQRYLPHRLPDDVTGHEISKEGIISVYHKGVYISMVPKFRDEILERDKNYGELQWTYNCKSPGDVFYRPCARY